MAPRATVVPHHRVDAALHARAKKKADAEGASLSAVAEAGLRAYTTAASSGTRRKAAKKVEDGRLAREAPTLPAVTAEEIRAMGAGKDPRLTAYLAALRAAGWSYATLAAPLGVSRQAVHLRLSGWDQVAPDKPLPPVPSGPGRTSFPAHPGTATARRFDWAIWVDRALYAVASEHAAAHHDAMRDVMERILDDYVSDRLAIEPTEKGRRSRRAAGKGET